MEHVHVCHYCDARFGTVEELSKHYGKSHATKGFGVFKEHQY